MNKKLFSFIFSILFVSVCVFAENPLLLTGSDLRLVTEFDKKSSSITGYHLYIRKSAGLESVMLTESSKDPEGKKDSYALRATEYNSVNGDEIRFLNGKKLESKYAKYSLIDSSAEKDAYFGYAFHIYIPRKVVFGYPWARSGTLEIKNGCFFNIRAFGSKYGDYTGGFFDNPFVLDLTGTKDEKKCSEPEISEDIVKVVSEVLDDETKEESEIETEEKSAVFAEDAKNESQNLIVSVEEGNSLEEESSDEDTGWISESKNEKNTEEKAESKTETEDESEKEENLVPEESSETEKKVEPEENEIKAEEENKAETSSGAESSEILENTEKAEEKASESAEESKNEIPAEEEIKDEPESEVLTVEEKASDEINESVNEEDASEIPEIKIKEIEDIPEIDVADIEVKDSPVSEETSDANAAETEKLEYEKSAENAKEGEAEETEELSEGETSEEGAEGAEEKREKTPEEIAEEEKAKEEAARKEFLKDYNLTASGKFDEISETMIYTKGPQTLIQDIFNCIDTPEAGNEQFDLVFVIDATGSMKDDIDELKVGLIAPLTRFKNRFKDFRVGLVYYRDYGDDFSYYGLPIKYFNFTDDMDKFNSNLNDIVITGSEGGDIPEAVYEGLYGGLALFTWNKDAYKKIVLIGDAEPHPKPRMTKRYTKKLVEKLASDKDVHINSIVTPDGRTHEREIENLERQKELEREAEKEAKEKAEKAAAEGDENTEASEAGETDAESEAESEVESGSETAGEESPENPEEVSVSAGDAK